MSLASAKNAGPSCSERLQEQHEGGEPVVLAAEAVEVAAHHLDHAAHPVVVARDLDVGDLVVAGLLAPGAQAQRLGGEGGHREHDERDDHAAARGPPRRRGEPRVDSSEETKRRARLTQRPLRLPAVELRSMSTAVSMIAFAVRGWELDPVSVFHQTVALSPRTGSRPSLRTYGERQLGQRRPISRRSPSRSSGASPSARRANP